MQFSERVQATTVRFLRWSEKYTKTDMVYLASGGFLSLVYQVTSIIASLALAIVVGHIVPQAVYGEYKYILSVVSILSFFSLNGIGSAVAQSTAGGFEGALQQSFWTNIRWSALVFLLATGFGIYYFFLGNAVLAIGILIGGFLTPIFASANLYSYYLAGKMDFVRQIIYGILDNIIPIGLFIAVIFITRNPLALVATYFISNVLATLFFYRRTIRLYRPDPTKTDRAMVSYSKHLSVMGILGGIADNLDQILLFHYVGAVQLAIYNFATAIPDQIKGPMKTIDAMILTRFTGTKSKNIRGSMRNKFFWFFIFTGAATALYFILAPFIFKVLFPAYIASIPYTRIYALWMVSASFDPAFVYLQAKKKVQEQYIVTVALSLFQIASMVVGVVWWGLLGLVIARLCTKWVSAILSFILYEITVRKDTLETHLTSALQ